MERNTRIPWYSSPLFLAAAIFFFHSPGLHAANLQEKVTPLINGPLRELASSLQVTSMVRAQNAMHRRLTPEDIEALDARWKEADTQLIDAVMDNDLSAYLKDYAARSDGLFTEIFVIDRMGLNVGQSAVTSDYWQGDEPIFIRGSAQDAYVSDVYLDESTGRQQVQVALPIRGQPDGEIRGVLAVGIDAEKLGVH